jgi:hypothetical protein
VNAPDGDGEAFAATAAAHLAPGGIVIGETYPPDWDPAAAIGQVTNLGDARIELLRASVKGNLLEAVVRYGVDHLEWEQPFTARLLGEDGLRALLAGAGLTFERWLDRPGWFLARAAPKARRLQPPALSLPPAIR